MALFPLGKGGGKGVAYGYKGKGILFHSITDERYPTTDQKTALER